jgi:hypothetical protein
MIRNPIRLSALAAGLGLALAIPGIALAQPPAPWGPGGPVAVGGIDRDADGSISPQEFADHRTGRQAARAAQGRPMRNAPYAPRFEDWDRDGNGALSPTELTQGQQGRMAARGPGRWAGMGPGAGPGPGPGPGWGRGMGPGPDRPCWRWANP